MHFLVERIAFRLYLSAKATKTAPGLAVIFMEGYDVPYGKIMATSTLIVNPVLICAVK